MRPWVNPHSRAMSMWGIGFPTGVTRLLSQYLNEFFEPVMTLLLDVMTAFVLGFFFVVQSLSVLVSFDSIVVAVIKAVQGLLYRVLAVLMGLVGVSDQDKRALGNAAIEFASNLLWAEMVSHNMTAAVRQQFFFAPCLTFAAMHCASSLIVKKMETEADNPLYPRLVMVQLVAHTAVLVVRVARTAPSDLPATLFLLKANIDVFVQSVAALTKCWARTSSAAAEAAVPRLPTDTAPNDAAATATAAASQVLDGNDPLSAANNIETCRQFFWLLMTVNQFMQLKNYRRQDLWFFYCVLFHLALSLGVHLREVSKRNQVRRMMARRFKRITPDELTTMREESCAVCLNEHTHESLRIPCSHVFHAQCLTRVLQATPRGQSARCPICRADIHTYSSANNTSGPAATATNRHATTAYLTRLSGLGLRHRATDASTASAGPGAPGQPSALLSIRILRQPLSDRAGASAPLAGVAGPAADAATPPQRQSHPAVALTRRLGEVLRRRAVPAPTTTTMAAAAAPSNPPVAPPPTSPVALPSPSSVGSAAVANVSVESVSGDSSAMDTDSDAFSDADGDAEDDQWKDDSGSDGDADDAVDAHATESTPREPLDSLLQLVAQQIVDHEAQPADGRMYVDADQSAPSGETQPRRSTRIDTALLAVASTATSSNTLDDAATLAGRKRKRFSATTSPSGRFEKKDEADADEGDEENASASAAASVASPQSTKRSRR